MKIHYLTFDLDFGHTKVAQYPLHYVIYASTRFEVATSNGFRLGPRVKKIKNGYPESSKDCYSINSKKYIWCIRNHCIASFSELHKGTRAKKVWWPMCVMCMHAFNTHAIISATHYQIEIQLPFRNDNVFVLKVLSISFNFKGLLL